MRISTPLTKERIKYHLTYNAWKYALLVVASVLGWNLIYSATTYRPPQEKRIDVFVQAPFAATEVMDEFLKPIWEKAAPTMETVESRALMVGDEYSATIQLSTYVHVGEGDIYLLTEQYFKNMASQGVFLPLEGCVPQTLLDSMDVSKGRITVVEEWDEKDQPVRTAQHLYGIPLDSLDGLMQGLQVDTRGMYAAILANNQNDENVIPFFCALLEAGSSEGETQMAE